MAGLKRFVSLMTLVTNVAQWTRVQLAMLQRKGY